MKTITIALPVTCVTTAIVSSAAGIVAVPDNTAMLIARHQK